MPSLALGRAPQTEIKGVFSSDFQLHLPRKPLDIHRHLAYTRVMLNTDAALTYLIERQRAEGISAAAMARKLGIDAGTWWQIRHRPATRRLTQAQVAQACVLYRELREQLYAEAETKAS